VGQLDADDKSQGKVALRLASEAHQTGDQFLHIGSIGVIGDGDGSVAPDDAAQELAGQQHPIAEERMDVEVNARSMRGYKRQESVLNVSSLLGWLGEQPAGYDLNQLVAA